MCYRLLKPLLFCLPAETAHHVTLAALNALYRLKLTALFPKPAANSKKLWDLEFKNPVGLAAGLDKNGHYIDALASLGFGFIEIGTVTPKPQSGNPKPRLFRIPEQEAIINRMGFNNKGIDALIGNVKRAKYKGILGINIGKNATTPIEEALDDYLICLNKAYPYASYITVNISSPNTAGLRNLQHGEYLENLLAGLKAAQTSLSIQHKKQVPLLIKVAPDLTPEEIKALATGFLKFDLDGIIATNTTLARPGITLQEAGGLSGAPLTQSSTDVLKQFKKALKGKIPIIAAGGIMTPEEAQAKFAAGADLIQLYSGLIYKGPSLLTRCIKHLQNNHQH